MNLSTSGDGTEQGNCSPYLSSLSVRYGRIYGRIQYKNLYSEPDKWPWIVIMWAPIDVFVHVSRQLRWYQHGLLIRSQLFPALIATLDVVQVHPGRIVGTLGYAPCLLPFIFQFMNASSGEQDHHMLTRNQHRQVKLCCQFCPCEFSLNIYNIPGYWCYVCRLLGSDYCHQISHVAFDRLRQGGRNFLFWIRGSN